MSLDSTCPKAFPRAHEPVCPTGDDPFLVMLDRGAAPGQDLRVLAVSERPFAPGVRLLSGDGQAAQGTPILWAGPPYALLFRVRAPAQRGRALFRLAEAAGAPAGNAPPARPLACTEVLVDARAARTPVPAPGHGIWATRRQWSPAWERVFSAFVAYLFRRIPGRRQGWRPLHQVLRDPARNLLYNRLGWREDASGSPVHIVAVADCGDTPYQIRAYFAWKFGLPFRFRRCTRGSARTGPRCPFARTHLYTGFDHIAHPVKRFNAFARQGLAWLVHSGTTRTLPEDDGSDFYPVPLSHAALRPGTIYVDVGGHVLLVTHRDRHRLVAIDGHPDFSVTERPFDPRYFRFVPGIRTGGFKAFRPIRMIGDRVVPVPNRALGPALSDRQYAIQTARRFRLRVLDALGRS